MDHEQQTVDASVTSHVEQQRAAQEQGPALPESAVTPSPTDVRPTGALTQDRVDETARTKSGHALTSSPEPVRSMSLPEASTPSSAVPPTVRSATSVVAPMPTSVLLAPQTPAASAAGPSFTIPSPPPPAQLSSGLTLPPLPPPKPIISPRLSVAQHSHSRSTSPSSAHHGGPSRTTSIRINEPLNMAGPYPVPGGERPPTQRRTSQRPVSPRTPTVPRPASMSIHGGQASQAQSVAETMDTQGNIVVKEKTVEERLKATKDHLEKEVQKYGKMRLMTKWSLNSAIGAQVVLGALTTGIAAATSGKQTSIAVSILGGLSTAAASYLAKMRGSGEPEFSSTMVKDLKNLQRELEAYIADYGDKSGEKYDRAVQHFRSAFEALLGHKPKGLTETLKDGVRDAGGYLAHAGQAAGHRMQRDLERGIVGLEGRMHTGLERGMGVAEQKVYGGLSAAEQRVHSGVGAAERGFYNAESRAFSDMNAAEKRAQGGLEYAEQRMSQIPYGPNGVLMYPTTPQYPTPGGPSQMMYAGSPAYATPGAQSQVFTPPPHPQGFAPGGYFPPYPQAEQRLSVPQSGVGPYANASGHYGSGMV